MRITTSAMKCASCGNHFNDIESFDAHRIGHVNTRRCLDPENAGFIRISTNMIDSWIWMLAR